MMDLQMNITLVFRALALLAFSWGAARLSPTALTVATLWLLPPLKRLTANPSSNDDLHGE